MPGSGCLNKCRPTLAPRVLKKKTLRGFVAVKIMQRCKIRVELETARCLATLALPNWNDNPTQKPSTPLLNPPKPPNRPKKGGSTGTVAMHKTVAQKAEAKRSKEKLRSMPICKVCLMNLPPWAVSPERFSRLPTDKCLEPGYFNTCVSSQRVEESESKLFETLHLSFQGRRSSLGWPFVCKPARSQTCSAFRLGATHNQHGEPTHSCPRDPEIQGSLTFWDHQICCPKRGKTGNQNKQKKRSNASKVDPS